MSVKTKNEWDKLQAENEARLGEPADEEVPIMDEVRGVLRAVIVGILALAIGVILWRILHR